MTRLANRVGFIMRFTLRTFLVAIGAVALVFASFTYFGTFGASVCLVAIGLFLRAVNRRRAIPHPAWLHRMLIWPATLWIVACLLGWIMLGNGPLLTRDSWPRELSRMVDIGEADSVGVHGFGRFLDAEYAWRMTINPDRLSDLLCEIELQPLERNDVPNSFFATFPKWWQLPTSEDCPFYSTHDFPNEPRGRDGYHFLAMFDTNTNRLYVWHKFNY